MKQAVELRQREIVPKDSEKILRAHDSASNPGSVFRVQVPAGCRCPEVRPKARVVGRET